nr:MAG TPA: hypothetical protein [Caudoviricetes sp.]DAS62919.1 MAG TPA: hypothetical protein [Caudoviricetes sp.]
MTRRRTKGCGFSTRATTAPRSAPSCSAAASPSGRTIRYTGFCAGPTVQSAPPRRSKRHDKAACILIAGGLCFSDGPKKTSTQILP